MTVGWSLVAGTATRYLLLAVDVCLGIFLMPYTVRHLVTSEYGLWMLGASMSAYFQLLDLGYGNGFVRHVAEADAMGDTALVAIGTAVPVIVANAFILLPIACRQVQLALGHFIRTVAVAPAVGASVGVAVGLALRSTVSPQSIAGVVLEGAIVGAAYMIAVWLFGFDRAVRARYLGFARHAFVSVLAAIGSATRRAGASPATI